MSAALEHMSRRVESDPFFFAHALAAWRDHWLLTDAALARYLGISPDELVRLKLAGAPRPGRKREDIEHLAAWIGCEVERLAAIAGVED